MENISKVISERRNTLNVDINNKSTYNVNVKDPDYEMSIGDFIGEKSKYKELTAGEIVKDLMKQLNSEEKDVPCFSLIAKYNDPGLIYESLSITKEACRSKAVKNPSSYFMGVLKHKGGNTHFKHEKKPL